MHGAAELLTRLERGDRRAIARALTLAENGGLADRPFLEACERKGGIALRIGITGAPGVGKSSLVDLLAKGFAQRAGFTAVLAVDPSSAFSRGALLGDRIRMQRATEDERIFVRSLATRGHLGGLTARIGEAGDVLDAAGCKVILIETVGVGQAEIDVAFETDLVLVVLAPGAGDGIQALKAGLMEIADLFVVNKCDREGADGVAADVETALELARERPEGRAAVLLASAATGQGALAIVDALQALAESRRALGRFAARREDSARRRLLAFLLAELETEIEAKLRSREDLVRQVARRELALREAARIIQKAGMQ